MAEVVSFANPATAFQKFLSQVDESLTTLITDPGDGGTIDVSNSGVLLLTVASGIQTRTLPAPTFEGQTMVITLDVLTGTSVVVSTSAGLDSGGTNGSLVFDAAGESARLFAVREGGTLVWRVLRADGSEPTLI